jgi:hypothetical protein
MATTRWVYRDRRRASGEFGETACSSRLQALRGLKGLELCMELALQADDIEQADGRDREDNEDDEHDDD